MGHGHARHGKAISSAEQADRVSSRGLALPRFYRLLGLEVKPRAGTK